jgi:hypothetical protein
MEAGEVFYWVDFPLQNDGELKNRYFLYLGHSSIVDTPIVVNLITTTTQLDYYKQGGRRANNHVFHVDKGKYPFFSMDCLLDLSIGYQHTCQSVLDNAQTNVLGKLEYHDLSMIFNKLVDAESVPPKRLREIRQRLEEVGCKNLKSVRSNR